MESTGSDYIGTTTAGELPWTWVRDISPVAETPVAEELTVNQIEERLGYKIKVVGEKNMNDALWGKINPGVVLEMTSNPPAGPTYALVVEKRPNSIAIYELDSVAAPGGYNCVAFGNQYTLEGSYLCEVLNARVLRVLDAHEWPLATQLRWWLHGDVGAGEVSWQREEAPHEYTVSQLEALVGHRIKIVGEHAAV